MVLQLAKKEVDLVHAPAGKGKMPTEILARVASLRARRGVGPPDISSVRRLLRGKTHRVGVVESCGRKPTLTKTDGRTDGRTDARVDRRTGGLTDGLTDGRMDGLTDGNTERRTNASTIRRLPVRSSVRPSSVRLVRPFGSILNVQHTVNIRPTRRLTHVQHDGQHVNVLQVLLGRFQGFVDQRLWRIEVHPLNI